MNRNHYLSGMCSKTALSGKSFAADVTVEGPVLEPLDLALVVAQVLLQVAQLDEGATAVRNMAFIRSLSCKIGSFVLRNVVLFTALLPRVCRLFGIWYLYGISPAR